MDRFSHACSIALASLALSTLADVPAEPRFPTPHGAVAVAFVLTEGANVMDFAGPWEVFQDAAIPGTEDSAFRLFTVSDSRRPLTLTGGLKVVPDYTFDDAPAAAVIVVGAQKGSPRMTEWLRRVAPDARPDV